MCIVVMMLSLKLRSANQEVESPHYATFFTCRGPGAGQIPAGPWISLDSSIVRCQNLGANGSAGEQERTISPS